jgi:GT2 family glycosyltransferase
MGGWPALPGWIGWDEEAVCLFAFRMGIPVVYVPGVRTWHLIGGGRTYEYSKFQVNLAAVYRILFDDAHWPHYRELLGNRLMLETKSVPIAASVLCQVETPAFRAYAETIRARFKQTDEQFLREWNG